MAESKIRTGDKGLDDDLQKVLEANSPKRRQEIKSAISDYKLSRTQLFEMVPEAIVRLALALRNPVSYEVLAAGASKETKEHLEKAKEIIEQHFVEVLKHPVALPPPRRDEEDEEENRAAVLALNLISDIRHIPLWKGEPPKMRPASRVLFFGMDGEVLLDSMLTWKDFLYVARTLTTNLICEMETGKALAKLGQVDLPNKDKMENLLRELEKNVARIRKLCPLYGLGDKAAGPKPDVEVE